MRIKTKIKIFYGFIKSYHIIILKNYPLNYVKKVYTYCITNFNLWFYNT